MLSRNLKRIVIGLCVCTAALTAAGCKELAMRDVGNASGASQIAASSDKGDSRSLALLGLLTGRSGR